MASETGDAIRRARGRKGMTIAELAAALGVSDKTVGNWERGVHEPGAAIGRITTVLGSLEDPGRPLADLTDEELLAEVGRRMRARFGSAGAPAQARSADEVDYAQQLLDSTSPEVLEQQAWADSTTARD